MSHDRQIEALGKKNLLLESVLRVLNTFLYDPASYAYYSISYITPFKLHG